MAKGKAGKRKAKAAAPRTASSSTSSKRRNPPRVSKVADKEAAKPESNPYDVFQNRRRRSNVLGEKVRGERRDLVKSKSSAVNSRASGLLKESLGDRRTSRFKDARLGGDAVDTVEPGGRSSVQRLVKLRQREAKRSFSIIPRGQDELMHDGKPLSAMEDSELRSENVDGDADDDANVFDPDDPIGRSKQQRAQAAQEKKEHEDQLGKLDDDFSSLLGELDFRPKKAEQLKLDAKSTKKDAPDEYDQLMRELHFERKAIATERTKSPEELARERAEELEALERERSSRASATLEEGEAQPQDEEGTLPVSKDTDVPSESESASEDEEGEDEESEEEDKEEHEAEDEEGASQGKVKTAEEEGVQAEVTEVDDDDKLGEDCIKLLSSQDAAAVDPMVNSAGEEGLPFSLVCPVRKRAIAELLAGSRPETAVKLVQRVRTCTAVSLSSGNRDKLRAFFLALLDYASDVAVRADDGDLSSRGLQILYALRPQLVQLSAEHPDEVHSYFAERLRVLGPATVPGISEFCCLKLIALIFPVTDFKHPITSPAALLAEHWASRMASLGAGIADLVSEAVFLWGILYDLVSPGGRFSSAFFQLGATILDSCWTSAKKGRQVITEASADVLVLLLRAIRSLAESEPAAARVVAREVLRPLVEQATTQTVPEGKASEQLTALRSVLEEVSSQTLAPLTLFEAPRPQIRTLEPIFHELGDSASRKRGMELTETQKLKRQLNQERRAANRQLKRDASALQSLATHKDSLRRAGKVAEKKRVSRMMEVEKQDIKKMMTEFAGMDTSIQSYSKNKEKKKENKRMGGNTTADSAPKDSKPGASVAKKEKVRKTPKKKGKR